MRVTFYQRRPQCGNFSVEQLFEDIRSALPDYIDSSVVICRFKSRGVWRRLVNIIEAIFHQGDVNHITGDVHYLAYFLFRRRTLLTILDLVTVHRLNGWRRMIFLFFWYWLPIKRAAIVSVISEATKKDLLRYIKIDPSRVVVIHCPVSKEFQPNHRLFNSEKPTILQIGTRSNKNLERVVHAIHGIACHLRIIGSLNDDQLSALKENSIEYSFIQNITKTQIIEEYRSCDLLVFASTFEGFGLPIVEAQAIGRPVVTSNIFSMPEVAGDAACLVDPFDVDSIRDGIMKISNCPNYREELVRLGFINVKRFQPKLIAKEYISLYEKLLLV